MSRPPLPRNHQEPSQITGAKWIPLTHGEFALIDEEDWARLLEFTWHLTSYGYAGRHALRELGESPDRKTRVFKMHRELLDIPQCMQVDHINGNRLDNRKSNLRAATNAQNNQNKRSPRNNRSGYKGVSWCKERNKWAAQIQVNGRQKNLGRFDNVEDAIRAYDEAARKLHGEFALTNAVGQ